MLSPFLFLSGGRIEAKEMLIGGLMKILKRIFKWIGLAIWLFLIFAFMQVPSMESTPLYSIDSQKQFFEAFRHVNLLHNIVMMIIFTIVTFIMEWFACIWLKNKLVFSKKIVLKYILLALGAGIFGFILDSINMASVFLIQINQIYLLKL